MNQKNLTERNFSTMEDADNGTDRSRFQNNSHTLIYRRNLPTSECAGYAFLCVSRHPRC